MTLRRLGAGFAFTDGVRISGYFQYMPDAGTRQSILKSSHSRHYVDNNSTPTMVSNLLEAKHSLFESTSSRHTLPRARLLCATIVHTPSCYARQSWLSATIPPPNPCRLCRPPRRATPKRVLRPAA